MRGLQNEINTTRARESRLKESLNEVEKQKEALQETLRKKEMLASRVTSRNTTQLKQLQDELEEAKKREARLKEVWISLPFSLLF